MFCTPSRAQYDVVWSRCDIAVVTALLSWNYIVVNRRLCRESSYVSLCTVRGSYLRKKKKNIRRSSPAQAAHCLELFHGREACIVTWEEATSWAVRRFVWIFRSLCDNEPRITYYFALPYISCNAIKTTNLLKIYCTNQILKASRPTCRKERKKENLDDS